MIPLSVMVNGRGTVSTRIEGPYHRGRPSSFTTILRPVIFWNITYQCNLKCEHCYINAGPNPGKLELGVEEALSIARQIVEHRIPLVVFTGESPSYPRNSGGYSSTSRRMEGLRQAFQPMEP